MGKSSSQQERNGAGVRLQTSSLFSALDSAVVVRDRMTDLKEQLQAVRTVASARHAGTGCQLQGKAPEGSFRECLAAAWAIGTSSGSFDFAAKRGYAQDGRLKRTAPSCKNKLPVHDTPGQVVSCQ